MHAIAAIPGSRTRRCLALAVIGAGLGISATGQTQTRPNAPTNLPGNDDAGRAGQYNRGFDSDPGLNSTYREFDRPVPLPIYFPPVAPRLQTHVDPPSIFEARKPAPAEIAPFVNEPFYAPLASRLAGDVLSRRQRQRLDAYLAAKLRLQNELRTHLAELATADSATRQREYAALAATENPQIDELERAAQQLRVDLINGEFYQANVDWNDSRDWRLGSSRFRSAIDAMTAQFQAMQSAAFYQKGLLPAQRRLLLEVGTELGEMPVHPPDSGELATGTTPTDTNPPLFFSPETSRVILPGDLPSDLADKVASYEREKSALKKELGDAVIRMDGAYFGFARNHASSVLAQQQQSRLATLEDLAEEIRRGLASLPNQPHPPEAPAIPPALTARITAFLRDKAAVRKDLAVLLLDARRNLDVQRINYSKTADGKYALNLSIRPAGQDQPKLKKLQENFAAFNRSAALRSAALEKELAVIRDDVSGVLDKGDGPGGDKAVTRFLSECADALEQREDWELYRDYRTAVLEPGLSPQQRRLLYDAALVDLNLPLPALERAPRESEIDRRPFDGG